MEKLEDQRGVHLLSLDGGGIRGISELIILEEIMFRIQSELGLREIPRPYEYFDLIGGTSTGGIIALMLGRLRMSTTEALAAYIELSTAVFSEKKVWILQEGLFKATKLETEIKKTISRYSELHDSDSDMLDTRDQSCKTFVCAVPAHDISSTTLLRTYKVPYTDERCKIWQAARATIAAPTIFKALRIGSATSEISYIDAALSCNNPVRHVLNEAKMVFKDRKVRSILSIGTGQCFQIGIQETYAFQRGLDFSTVLKSIATDAARVAKEMEHEFVNTKDVYFRFSVEQGLQNITTDEWKRVGEVQMCTRQYLGEAGVSKRIDAVVRALIDKDYYEKIRADPPKKIFKAPKSLNVLWKRMGSSTSSKK
ncbi:acyl transferase/acyl hydrolase/lysophospholipase [Pyronema omphalodes]|nr:acyl transferase/acyl hydrolase/lysophospholipase [Pyronema omphalodes]